MGNDIKIRSVELIEYDSKKPLAVFEVIGETTENDLPVRYIEFDVYAEHKEPFLSDVLIKPEATILFQVNENRIKSYRNEFTIKINNIYIKKR